MKLTTLTLLPLLALASCSNDKTNSIEPLAGEEGNAPPEIEVTAPASDVSIEVGEPVEIRWIASDRDDVALTTVQAVGLSGEATVVLASAVPEDDGTEQSVTWIPAEGEEGSYRITAFVQDEELRRESDAPGTVEVSSAPVEPNPVSGAALLSIRGFAGTVQAFPDDSFAVTGVVTGSAPVVFESETLDPVELSATSNDAYAARFAPDGSFLWATKTLSEGTLNPSFLGGSDESAAFPLDSIALPDGQLVQLIRTRGVVVVGEGETNEATFDGKLGRDLLVALAGDGTVAWARFVHDSFDEQEHTFESHLTRTPDGNVVVVGTYYADVLFGFGEASETLLAGDGLFRVVYDGEGDLVMAESLLQSDTAYDTRVASNELGSWVAGLFFDNLTFDLGGPGETMLSSDASNADDQFLAHYGPDGSFQWAKHSVVPDPESDDPLAYALVVDADGEATVMLADIYEGEFTFGFGEAGEETYTVDEEETDGVVLLAHYSAEGLLEWLEPIEGELGNFDDFDSSVDPIAVLEDGDIALTFAFYDFVQGSEFFLEHDTEPGLGTLFVARFTQDGDLVWALNDGGTNDEVYSASIEALSAGRVLVRAAIAGDDSTFGTNDDESQQIEGSNSDYTVRVVYQADGSL